MRTQTQARAIALTTQMRHVPKDHVAAVAADFDGVVYFMPDGSKGKFEFELDERGRNRLRFIEVA